MADSSPITTFDRAVAFLMSLVRDDPRPYRARAELAVRALLARIGDPHAALPVVHIAGSKGKGSTALYLEAILDAMGLRTGTFTSPHLQRWTERYRIDARESTQAELTALLTRLQPHVLALTRESDETAPSFFDVLTAAAFLLFAERNVDCAIIETGIGGRLDATNVVRPLVGCITSVELEHTDKLGDSIREIAAEKAGIIKADTPMVVGALPVDAESVVRERAARMCAPISALDREIGLRIDPGAVDGLTIRVTEENRTYQADLPENTAVCNARNAALAIACARRVVDESDCNLQPAVTEALAHTRPPGRMEVVGRSPWIVVDGAHTRDSSQALADMLESLPARRVHLIVSLSVAKDACAVLAPLLHRADRVVVTSADPSRSVDGRRIATNLVENGLDATRVRAIADPRQAVLETRGHLAADDLLCVTGSMYMAGVAREALLGSGTSLRQLP